MSNLFFYCSLSFESSGWLFCNISFTIYPNGKDILEQFGKKNRVYSQKWNSLSLPFMPLPFTVFIQDASFRAKFEYFANKSRNLVWMILEIPTSNAQTWCMSQWNMILCSINLSIMINQISRDSLPIGNTIVDLKCFTRVICVSANIETLYLLNDWLGRTKPVIKVIIVELLSQNTHISSCPTDIRNQPRCTSPS